MNHIALTAAPTDPALAAYSRPSAEVIADSISPDGDRIITIQTRHPRFVHAETMTHGHAQNSASSRARPTKTMLLGLVEDIAMPVEFGRLQPGMQAGDPLTGDELLVAATAWHRGALRAIQTTLELYSSPQRVHDALDGAPSLDLLIADDSFDHPESLLTTLRSPATIRKIREIIEQIIDNPGDGDLLVHKQIANRPLEPYMWHTSVQTAVYVGDNVSSWMNLIGQRATPTDGTKPLAQPEFTALADMIREAIEASRPAELEVDQWHTPYVNPSTLDDPNPERLARILSVARVARTSFVSPKTEKPFGADLDLFIRLAYESPPHWSPFEHVAAPYPAGNAPGRFKTWRSLRHDPDQLNVLKGYAANLIFGPAVIGALNRGGTAIIHSKTLTPGQHIPGVGTVAGRVVDVATPDLWGALPMPTTPIRDGEEMLLIVPVGDTPADTDDVEVTEARITPEGIDGAAYIKPDKPYITFEEDTPRGIDADITPGDRYIEIDNTEVNTKCREALARLDIDPAEIRLTELDAAIGGEDFSPPTPTDQ